MHASDSRRTQFCRGLLAAVVGTLWLLLVLAARTLLILLGFSILGDSDGGASGGETNWTMYVVAVAVALLVRVSSAILIRRISHRLDPSRPDGKDD